MLGKGGSEGPVFTEDQKNYLTKYRDLVVYLRRLGAAWKKLTEDERIGLSRPESVLGEVFTEPLTWRGLRNREPGALLKPEPRDLLEDVK
jgi:hypothetical protein